MAARRDLISYFAFNSGELSPLMASRQDQARYPYGLKRMRNFIPALQGPARKRPGLRFVAETALSSKRSWLVPFVFSQRDAWVLEFGDATLRFYTDHGQVLETTTVITAMTNASPGLFTKTAHGLSAGQEVYIGAMPGTTGIAGRNFRINSTPTADTFTLKDLYGTVLDTTSLGTYAGSGTFARVYEIATPWAITDLTNSDTDCCLISSAQSGDVLYICVPGFRTQKLTRTTSTSWAFSDFSPEDGPFETVDPDETITVYASAGTGAVTLTASSGIFSANHVGGLFLLEMKNADANGAWEVGKAFSLNTIVRSQGHYYKCTDAGTSGTITPSHTEGARYDGADTAAVCQWQYLHSGYGWALITGYTSTTVVSATVQSTIPDQAVGSGNASTRWAFGAWSAALGWPTHVAFFRERLVFARGTRIWGSVPSDFESFAQRDAGVVAADSAFDIDIRSGVNDDIQWIVPSSDLLVGTEGGEFAVGEISSADPLGPDNIAALAGPGYGARRVTPVNVNDAVMYVMPSGRVLRELRFTFETDGYSALNRTAFAEHIAKGQLNQLAYQREAESILWGHCGNGDLLSMSYEREHDLVAWAKHLLGGAFGSTTNAIVESVAVIPSPDGVRDELYVCAKLTINGATKRYVGYLTEHWDEESDALENQFYVDWGLVYSGSATSTLSGLHHLEGEEVSVFGDGRDLGDFTVTAGAIDLGEAEVETASVGLAYAATLESMNLVKPGLLARIIHVYIRFIATISAAWATVTQREQSSETSTSRAVQMGNVTVSAPAQPVTRLVKAPGESGHGRELTWIITHDRPTYCAVASVVPDLASEARQ